MKAALASVLSFCVIFGLVALPGAPARALPLDLERTGLAWSAAEVDDAGDPALRSVLDRASRDDALGCRALCVRIERVWWRLLAVLPPLQARGARLHVVRLDDEAAFATPGGDVVLSESFVLQRRLDDAELAFVLAHELAHVLLQHERQTLTAALALMPRVARRTVRDVYVELQFDPGLQARLEPVFQQAEFEADEIGLDLAALAGFAPDMQLGFLAGNAALDATREILASTHGSAAERLAAARVALPLASRLYESVTP